MTAIFIDSGAKMSKSELKNAILNQLYKREYMGSVRTAEPAATVRSQRQQCGANGSQCGANGSRCGASGRDHADHRFLR